MLIFALILAACISFFAAFSFSTSLYKTRLAAIAQQKKPADSSAISFGTDSKLGTILTLIQQYSYYDVSEEDLCRSQIEGFAFVKQDAYSYYYDADEFATLTASNAGENQGIGVTVIEDTVNHLIKIVSVIKDSPAEKAGVKINDRIFKVIDSEGVEYNVADLGYETAVKKIQGVKGTVAKFTVARGPELQETQSFEIMREPFTSESVLYHVCDIDKDGKKVGYLKMTGFDMTTPPQFCDAMDALIAAGCEYFLFDVRYNPGGDLASITAVLSTMLNEGDTVIITKDRAGNTETTLVKEKLYGVNSGYKTCEVKKEDIGKYRSYVYGKSAILTNGNTASAAELFTSSLKDYKVAVSVGTKTYGKGSMQSIINLGYYGYSGALKLTTKKYFPPISEGYDGIGISPDVEIELDPALAERNIYDIADTEDNQIIAAIKAIK